jgi:hypothetical protein
VVTRVAEVVLHVSVALDVVGQKAALELGEDVAVGLVQHVGEHVEPTAMRHAHDDLLNAEVARAFDEGVEQRHQRLAALQGESLLANELGVQELLEKRCRRHLAKELDALSVRKLGGVQCRFDLLLEPSAQLFLRDVHVLDAQRAAVGGAQPVDELL